MTRRVTLLAIGAATLVLAGLLLLLPRSRSGDERSEGEAAEFARGPHGGRMLQDGDFALEVTIFERGVPPELRVYPYRDGKPLDPAGVTLEVELARLGSRVDRHAGIGRGLMGKEPFRYLLNDRRFSKVPMYLETPKGMEKGKDLDTINLRVLRSLIN